jgi:hypothetical protein
MQIKHNSIHFAKLTTFKILVHHFLPMPRSNFKDDLNSEAKLASHLDLIYPKIFSVNNYSIDRVKDLELQHRGIDLILSNSNRQFFVDEKAQLDYLNTSLPTFAFELSYLKQNKWHKGWLYDKTKETDIYFLLTDIHFSKDDSNEKLSKVKITGVYRDDLKALLQKKELTENRLFLIEKELRQSGKHGRYPIQQLNPKTEGVLFYSKNNKSEQPINLVLKLDWLVKEKVGKIIFQI